jgi:hypothetical protein
VKCNISDMKCKYSMQCMPLDSLARRKLHGILAFHMHGNTKCMEY